MILLTMPEKSIMMLIEIITAVIIITTLSTSPTAVRMESKENTISTKIIWITTIVMAFTA